MRLGKLLSVGEVAERAPIVEPVIGPMGRPEPAQPAPGDVARNDEQTPVLAAAHTGR